MPLYKLKHMFFDGNRHRPGEVVDLPAHRAPKSATLIDAQAPPSPMPIGRVEIRGIPTRNRGMRWQTIYKGKGEPVVLDEFTTKNDAELLRVHYDRDSEALRDRLDEMAEKTPPEPVADQQQEGPGDAV